MLGEGAAEIIEDDTHGDFGGSVFQGIRVADGDVVVVKDVDLDVDELSGGGDLPVELGEKLWAVDEIGQLTEFGAGKFFVIQHGLEGCCTGCFGDEGCFC